MNATRRLRVGAQILAVAALAACGGGSGDAPPAEWSEPVLLATTPGALGTMSAKEDASGAWTVAWWQSHPRPGSSGWLHRGAQGAWSSIPGVPVLVEPDRNSLAAFVTSADGPLGALVFDDGYRFDEAAWVDTDPRPRHFEPFVRSAGAWQSQPEIAPGIPAPACVQSAASQGLCLLSDPADGYPRPVVLRFTAAQGWVRTAEALDMGADEIPNGAHIRLRSLAMNPAGDALAVWERGIFSTGVPLHTAYHFYQPATGWSALGVLPDVDTYTRQGLAAATGAGSFMVPYVACTPNTPHPDVERPCAPAVARYTPSSGWQTQELAPRIPVKLGFTPGWGSHEEPLIRNPELHVGAAGQVLAFWWVDSQQWSRVFHPQQGWGPVTAVQSIPAPYIHAAHVDSEGNALIVDDKGVMRYSPQNGWRRIAPLPAGAAGNDVHHRLATIDAQGNVTLVWAKMAVANGVTTTPIFTAQFRP